MQNIILTIHLIIAIGLIIVVLLQRSEGGGLGIGGGGGGGGGLMTSRGAATALSKVTWALGAAFVVTSITLTIIAAREGGSGSVLDRLGIEAPLNTEQPVAPAPAPNMPAPDLAPPPAPDAAAPAPATPAAPAPSVDPAAPPPAQ
ncbi:MAG: preprotein translocase subunit SecG [Rhodovulum sulfidophilum]|uniref:Protein-export membrane protein SecG n=1 Tax=Rhodovulum sulfidophilum TaxID=35806 RepID=A0A2W5N3C2_RHOSU|nr:MAG: preprotein translocase subunit SecG [Rhodovulum sulfidophilum]